MPGPYSDTEFVRAESDVPGPNNLYYYWHHASGLCHLAVWRPSASFKNAPVAVFIHGGLGYNPGWRAMEDNVITGKYADLAAEMSTKGWVVISLEYPTCARNASRSQAAGGAAEVSTGLSGTWEEIHPIAFWPEQPAYIALAIQHIKSNWSGIADETATLKGAELWGANNSIDPDYIHLIGNSWGGTMAMYTALQPSGYYPYIPENAYGEMDPMMPRASHRVRSVSAISPQIDFTQWYFDTGDTVPLDEMYHNDRMQAFMRRETMRRWSTLPMAWKKQSPWWILQEYHPENTQVAFNVEFFGTGIAGWEQNLTYQDWSPGSVRDDVAEGKAWVDPHNGKFQGKPLRDALLSYGEDSSAPIRKSRVAWTGAGSLGDNIFGAANYSTQMFSWLRSIGYPTQYT